MIEREKYLKRAKTWNIVLMLLTAFTILMNAAALSSTLNPQRSAYDTFEKAGMDADKMFQHANTLPVKVMFILGLALSVCLVVSYFLAHKKMAADEIPTKWPYLVLIGWQVIDMLFNIVYDPTGVNLTTSRGMISLVMMYAIACVLPVVVYYNLFHAEKSTEQLS